MATVVGPDDGAANHHVVFIDTSLDTHLVTIVSDSDTVSDFKRKILFEHRKLFPAIGEIKVECLKVKREGIFYHLSDSVLVKCALGAIEGTWFVSVDASRVERIDGIQQFRKHKAGDQLALPWVTNSHSIERHDNHGSPSVYSKTAPLETAPLVNQKVLNCDQHTSGDSCKDVSKNVEEDRLCNDRQLDDQPQEKLDTVNKDINSKKRTRDVHNENSPIAAFGHEPSVKKKRKTQSGKINVEALEGNLALTHDIDKVSDKGASINNDDSFVHRPEGKDLSDENKRIKKGDKCAALDQLATAAATIEGDGSENVGDVAMVVENNIEQEMSIGMYRKEKDSDIIGKPTTENEEHASVKRTPDCERDAAGVTAAGHMKRSTKHTATDNKVSSTSFIKEFHNTNKDANEPSQQDDNQERAGDQIDKYKDELGISLKQKPELKLPGRKKVVTGCENAGEGKRKKSKRLFKHSDNLVGEISSTVVALASVIDERKTNEVSEKMLVDAKKGDDVIMKELEISEKTLTDTNYVVTATNEENVLPHSQSLLNDDADVSTIGKDTSQVNAQGVLDNLDKQNEKTEDATKKKKKKKSKKSAGRNEDESITKHVNRDICENVKDSESGLPDTDRKHGDMSSTALASIVFEGKLKEDSEKTLVDAKKGDGVIVTEVEISVENTEEKSRKEFTDADEVVSVTNEENVLTQMSTTGKNTSQVNEQGMSYNLEKQSEKTDDTTKKKKRTKKSAARIEAESMTKNATGDICENIKKGDRKDGDKVKEKDAQISYDGLAGKEHKNAKSQDLQVELQMNKSQSVDHHHLPEKTSKNVSASEVSKVNNEVDNRKDMKRTKVDSRNDQSSKLVSKIENNKIFVDVLKDPNFTNIDKLRPPKRTKKIDTQKTNKQQSTLVQTHAKNVEDKKVNSSQKVKSSLNAPGTIFGDNSDSDSSTHAASGKSSSSGEIYISQLFKRTRFHARKGNEDAGKADISSQDKLKEPTMGRLLRSSSAFKKAKVTASSQVEDGQPVDFVPVSQL